MDKIWVRDLDIRVDFVLGLDFIIHNKGGTLITRDGILFMKNITYTSVLTNKIETKLKNKEKCCDNCENNIQCIKKECSTLYENTLEIDEEDEIINKNYVLIEMETELYNFKTGIQQIGQIKNQKDLDNIVRILDQIEIIGEKPLKHWENNHIVCKLGCFQNKVVFS